MALRKEEKKIVSPEAGEILPPAPAEVFPISKPENPEMEKVRSPEDEALHLQLRRRIEAMELSEGLQSSVSKSAGDVTLLAQKEEQVKKLLKIASQKGVIYAINVAKKINDPYLLDTLHDRLADGGYYTHFKP